MHGNSGHQFLSACNPNLNVDAIRARMHRYILAGPHVSTQNPCVLPLRNVRSVIFHNTHPANMDRSMLALIVAAAIWLILMGKKRIPPPGLEPGSRG